MLLITIIIGLFLSIYKIYKFRLEWTKEQELLLFYTKNNKRKYINLNNLLK